MTNESINDISEKKRLPYSEGEEYVSGLIDRAVEAAIAQRGARVKSRWQRRVMLASAAAVALLVVGIGFSVLTNENRHATVVATERQSPIDEFLNTLTDEEVAQLPCYEIEEIPEY